MTWLLDGNMDQEIKKMKFLGYLKAYWKVFLGFFSIILGYFLYKRNENEWKKNYENSLKTEKEIKEIHLESFEKETLEKQEIEKDHKDFIEKSTKAIEKMRKDLHDKKEKEKNKESIAKSIADLTGADYVKKDD